MNPSQSQSQGTQSEEYYEDEYDEDYVQDELIPAPAVPIISRRQDIDASQAKKRTNTQGEAENS